MQDSRIQMVWSGLLAATAALGCDSQARPDYSGEPLLTIRGSVTVPDGQEGQDLVPALAFFGVDGAAPYHVVDTAVDGDFPSGFTLTVYDPPPAELINGAPLATWRLPIAPPGADYPDEPPFAWARITAAASDHPAVIPSTAAFAWSQPACEAENCLAGLSFNYVIVYLERAAPAGSMTAAFFGATELAAGYHLFHGQAPGPEDPALSELSGCMHLAESSAVDLYNAAHDTEYEDLVAFYAGTGLSDDPALWSEETSATYEEFDALQIRAAFDAGCNLNTYSFEAVDDPSTHELSIELGEDPSPSFYGHSSGF